MKLIDKLDKSFIFLSNKYKNSFKVLSKSLKIFPLPTLYPVSDCAIYKALNFEASLTIISLSAAKKIFSSKPPIISKHSFFATKVELVIVKSDNRIFFTIFPEPG